MPDLEILPATPERWPAVELLLGDGATPERGCWCQAWRGRDTVALAGGRSRRDLLRDQLAESPPPGFLALRDGEPVGWVGVAVRTLTPRLARSRTIPAVDDRPVWVIGCFRVRPGFRRQGVAAALLAGVVEAARAAGAPGVEAYPVDPGGRRIDTTFAFVGLASMFDRAGFERVLVTDAHSAHLPRLLVRRMFAGS